MSDRHPKWVRVEPGTVIPAGQPYRLEWDAEDYLAAREHRGNVTDLHVGTLVTKPDRVFIDSSWKPPLDLPTEPTWGIAVHADPQVTSSPLVGVWYLNAAEDFCRKETQGCGVGSWRAKNILDFIPLTDEQVKRIEGAR